MILALVSTITLPSDKRRTVVV